MDSSLLVTVFLALGLAALAVLITVLVMRPSLVQLRARSTDLEQNLARTADELARLRQEKEEAIRQVSGMTSQLQAEKEKQALLELAEQKLREAFQALSSEALDKNSEAFVRLAKTAFQKEQEAAQAELEKRKQAVESLVKPLNESLKEVRTYVEKVDKEREGTFRSLADQVKNLNTETGRLSRALRQPTVRGRWGEVQLQRVVEMAGMSEYCDFQQQVTIEGETTRRPDLVVRLPGNRVVFVDAKAPLEPYLNAIEAEDRAEQDGLFEQFALGVRNHVKMLASKAYHTSMDSTPDFVVLFLPGEVFFGAALQRDPHLIEFASDRNVVLAAPSTLIALLRAVAYGWQQQEISETARKIVSVGKELFDRVGVLAGHFADLKRGLDRAVSGYNKAVGSLESRVLVTARKLNELAAPGATEIETPEPIEQATRLLGVKEAAGEGAGSGIVTDGPEVGGAEGEADELLSAADLELLEPDDPSDPGSETGGAAASADPFPRSGLFGQE